jgi:hypothetical protein
MFENNNSKLQVPNILRVHSKSCRTAAGGKQHAPQELSMLQLLNPQWSQVLCMLHPLNPQ